MEVLCRGWGCAQGPPPEGRCLCQTAPSPFPLPPPQSPLPPTGTVLSVGAEAGGRLLPVAQAGQTGSCSWGGSRSRAWAGGVAWAWVWAGWTPSRGGRGLGPCRWHRAVGEAGGWTLTGRAGDGRAQCACQGCCGRGDGAGRVPSLGTWHSVSMAPGGQELGGPWCEWCGLARGSRLELPSHRLVPSVRAARQRPVGTLWGKRRGQGSASPLHPGRVPPVWGSPGRQW